MSEQEIDAHNLAYAWREIMGRVHTVEHELGLIGGHFDDVRVYEPVPIECEAELDNARKAARALRVALIRAGAR